MDVVEAFDVGSFGFVAEDEGVGSAAVEESEGDGGVGGVEDGALSFDDDDVVVLVSEDEFFGGAVDEVGDDGVDGSSVAFDHDAGLSGGDELGVFAPGFEVVGEFDGDDHFSDGAVLADGVESVAGFVEAFGFGDFVFVVFADVPEMGAGVLGGGGDFGVIGEVFVESGDDGHAAFSGFEQVVAHGGG